MSGEQGVPYGDGAVTVRDYGGDGPDVLFVHAPGFCAAAWDRVAGALAGQVRARALDLPGHGGSSATARGPADAWGSVLAVVRSLGLRSPQLVALGQGSHTALAAAIESPAEIGGVVALGGACVRDTARAADDIAFYTSGSFTTLLSDRFFFGRTGKTQVEADDLVERITSRLARDWRVVGFAGLRDEVRYSIRPLPDDEGWVHLPRPESILRLVDVDEADPLFPDVRLYKRIRVPVVLVQLLDGQDQAYAARERDLAAAHPLVDLRTLDSGDYPHYARPDEIASIVLDAAGVRRRNW